jgi:hypothetical protein
MGSSFEVKNCILLDVKVWECLHAWKMVVGETVHVWCLCYIVSWTGLAMGI